MAELVAVQSGLALFREGDVGIVVDTHDLNPYDPQPLETIVATGTWNHDIHSDDVPAVCYELADAALEFAASRVTTHSVSNDDRLVRVPKRVQDAARDGVAVAQQTDAPVPVVAAGLLAGVATVGNVKRIHQYFTGAAANADDETYADALYGGDAGREWAAKVCGEDALTAATTPPVDTDVSVDYFATFAPGGGDGTDVRVDSLLARDADGAWWLRELGEWSPTQAPDDGADLVMLDEESFRAAAAQLDEPGTEYAELALTEEALHALVVPQLDLDHYDAVFAAVPYVPPEVRSANAKKQLRDAKGQFIQQGGVVQSTDGERGTVAGVDRDAGTVDVRGADGQLKTVPANAVTVDKNADGVDDSAQPKARLPKDVTLVPDVKALLAETVQRWAEEKNGEEPVVAAVDPLIPPDEPAPASPAPTASGPSTPIDGQSGDDSVIDANVAPLYLAQVDPQDTQAVLELIAVLPSQGGDDQIDVYTRGRDGWKSDEAMRTQLQGPTPPPVVQLTAEALAGVVEQVDGQSAESQPVAAAGYAVVQQFSIGETGLVASQTQGAVLLVPYGETLPDDIVARLNELAEGGLDKNRGGAEHLRRYWVYGVGAQKIRWGVPGDFNRCRAELGKYLGPRAAGYCQLRHRDATGFWAGHAPSEQRPHGRRHG